MKSIPKDEKKVIDVSIQLVSLARRELAEWSYANKKADVSIQLVSLARRELFGEGFVKQKLYLFPFN